MSWEEMEEAGWERRICEKTKRVTYARPREAGRIKIVSRRRDLREGEEGLGDILFPLAHKKARQEEQEMGEAQEVGEEAEGMMERAEQVRLEQVQVEVSEEAEEAGEMLEIKMEHKEELKKMAAVLKEVSLKEMNNINTNEMVFELHKAMREKDNPLRQELPLDINKNFFVEVLKYGLTRTEKLVHFILKLMTTHEREFDECTVVMAGKIFTIIAANINPEVNSVYRKKVGVFLQSCGLSSKGIAAMHALGECESVRGLRHTKTDLAIKDEDYVINKAKESTPAIVFDNMDKRAMKVLQHYTLPVQLFPNAQAVAVGETTDGINLNDVLKSVDFNYINMNSDKNLKEKTAFLNVTHTVLAQICSTIKNFEWAADMFPKAHVHEFKETAKMKTESHTDTTINRACMKTSDVIQVLSQLIRRFLTLLAERLEEEAKAAYNKALFDITSEDSSLEELRAAEQVIEAVLEKYGKLILFGDQKTVDDVQTAIEARKDGFTKLESFAYVMIVIPGDFHVEMSATMKTAEVMLKTFSSNNPLTIGQLATRLVVSHRLSSDPSVIKKSGNYEENRQFPVAVATEMLRDGMAMYKAELEAGTEPIQKTKGWLVTFFSSFLKARKIRLWFSEEDKPEFFDDIQAYASNLVSRVLLQLVHRHAVKYGDPVALRACHKIYTLFFLAHNGNRSRYAPTLLFKLVDYERLCSKDKNRVDLLCSINTTGVEGEGAAADMVNEWAVGDTKPLYDRYGNNYDVTQIDCAMKANNIIGQMKNDFLDSVGRSDLKSRRGNSHNYFKAVEEELREEVEAVSPLDPKPEREKVVYQDKFADLWDGMTVRKVTDWLEHKMQLYEGSRLVLP